MWAISPICTMMITKLCQNTNRPRQYNIPPCVSYLPHGSQGGARVPPSHVPSWSAVVCLVCFVFFYFVSRFCIFLLSVCHLIVCNMLYFAFYLPPIMCVVLVCIIFCTRCVLFAPGSHHCAQDRETCTITQHHRPYSGLRTFFVSACSPLCFPIPLLGSNSSGFL